MAAARPINATDLLRRYIFRSLLTLSTLPRACFLYFISFLSKNIPKFEKVVFMGFIHENPIGDHKNIRRVNEIRFAACATLVMCATKGYKYKTSRLFDSLVFLLFWDMARARPGGFVVLRRLM